MKKTRNIRILFSSTLLLIPTTLFVASCSHTNNKYVYVDNYCDSTGKEDCSDIIQDLIDSNPNRTLFFNDGTYLLGHPIKTYAEPSKTVDIKLSNFAVLKAMPTFNVHREITADWMDDNNYMVQLGVDRANKQTEVGNNYSFSGGVIDGSGIAPAIEIAGGRETSLHDFNIKNAQIGIRVAKGVNGNGSADADIRCVSINCNDNSNSIGLKVDAFDNTFTSIRMGHCNKGVIVTTTGNSFRDFHLLCNKSVEQYGETSIGVETNHGNWYNAIYVDNFRIAFKLNGRNTFNDCVAWWFSDDKLDHPCPTIAIDNVTDKFESFFFNLTCGFKPTRNDEPNTLLKLEKETTPEQSKGIIFNTYIWGKNLLGSNEQYLNYHKGLDVEY